MSFFRRKIKADSIYTHSQKSGQTRNFNPIFPDNINYLQNYAVKKGFTDGFALSIKNIIGSGIVNTIVKEAVGNGLSCESSIDSAFFKNIPQERINEIQKQIESYFAMWSSDPVLCDYRNVSTLGKLEQMILRLAVSQGDVFVIVRIEKVGSVYFPQLELVHPLLCESPNGVDTDRIISGIEFDRKGREVAYYFKKIDNSQPNSYEWQRITKYSRNGRVQVVHAKFNDVHPSQARGRSLLTPETESLIQIDRFIDANLSKAVMQAGISYSIEKDLGVVEEATSTLDEIKSAVMQSDEETLGQTTYSEGGDAPLEIKPGMTIEMRPGERLKSFESSAPVTGFKEFMLAMADVLASDNGIPSSKLFKKFDASYSASQASMQEAHKNAEYWKSEICNSVLNEIYSQFVWCLAVQGLVEMDGYFDSEFNRKAWSQVQWYSQALVHIDPVKAVNASMLKVKYGFSTYETETRNLTGQSWDTVVDKLADERKRIIDANTGLANPLGLDDISEIEEAEDDTEKNNVENADS